MSNITAQLRQQSSKKLAMLAEYMRTNEHQSFASEPLAIIGMGCRFPGGVQTPEQFWDFLQQGGNGIVDIPNERWSVDEFYHKNPDVAGKSYSRWGGFLDDVSHFDPAFFNISPREAQQMDPRQRLLLETAWEALEHANIAAEHCSASKTGVFIGHMAGDYHALQANNLAQIDSYVSTGVLDSLLANRLSYVLNLQGPSIAVDTACSSALTALYLACQSLRQDECNMALVGGVNLILSPEMQIMGAKAGILSPVGRCSTFSNTADGFVRGEGCGILVVKRLADALRNNDTILSVVRGAAINQDGCTNGIAAPNGFSQQRVIQQALKNALLDAEQVTYIETHGTGTLVGDPIEVEALSEIYGAASPQGACFLGAVKTNIGHLEGAAGIASLIKSVLCLHKAQIPPNINFDRLNPHINLDPTRFKLPLETQAWKVKKGLRYAAVSSFGIGGTNGHIILEEAPSPLLPKHQGLNTERSQHLLTLSAQNQTALTELVTTYQTLITTQPDINIADLAFTLNTGRNHFKHRIAMVATAAPELATQLAQWKTPPSSAIDQQDKAKIAFLFTGQGSQYKGMGRSLYETQATFKHHLDRCATLLAKELDYPLLDILYDDAIAADVLNKTIYTQPALFALEYALAKLWQSWGITPAAVMGHSVGEYVAACLAGVFSLEAGLQLIAARARLMQALPQDGAMLSVRATQKQVQPLLLSYKDLVSIAAFNGDNSLVLSGNATAIAAIEQQLQREAIDTRQLLVSHAFHSPLMDAMLEEFEQVAQTITYADPQIELISNLTGTVVVAGQIDAQYWVNHVRQAVRFNESMHTLHTQAYNVFIEMGAKPTLTVMGQQCIADKQTVWVSSLQPKKSDDYSLLTALASLYQRGLNINWHAFDKGFPRRKLTLPTYPFQRDHYWLNTQAQSETTKRLSPLITSMTRSPLLQEILFETDVNLQLYPFLNDHRIYNEVVIPGAAYLATLFSAGELLEKRVYRVQDVIFSSAMVLEEQATRTLQIVLTPKKSPANEEEAFDFQLISLEKEHYNDEPQTHMMGQFHPQFEYTSAHTALNIVQQRCTKQRDPQRFYALSREQHIVFGERFQWLNQLWKGDGETLAQLSIPTRLGNIEDYGFHPALLDACFQVAAATLLDDNEVATWLPFLIRNIYVYANYRVEDSDLATTRWWCHAKATGDHTWDICLFDLQGEISVEILGYEERQAPSEALLGKPLWHDWLYQTNWQAQDIATNQLVLNEPVVSKSSQTWLIFADKIGVATQLAQQLTQQNIKAILVFSAGNNLQQVDAHLDAHCYAINPNIDSDYRALLTQFSQVQKIVYLWHLDVADDVNYLSDEQTLFNMTEQLSAQLLYLTQAISQTIQHALDVLLLTQNAQAIGNDDLSHFGLSQAALLGMINVIRMEHPNLAYTLLDFSEANTDEIVTTLLAELNYLSTPEPVTETQIAYRKQQRYVARLTPYSNPTFDNSEQIDTLELKPDASYLITGGTGGLGLVMAQQLIEQGAKQLILLARSIPTHAIKQKITLLEDLGASIDVVQVDISQTAQLAAVINQLAAHYPLKGIIHAAGVLDDGVIQWQTRERFANVMQAKIQGAWNLHILTTALPLDFFVLFSSLSAVLGTVGQANYAAANAFLDQLAHYRRQQGLAALSINWGAWSEVGMAAKMSQSEQQTLLDQGETLLTPQQGVDIFSRLLSQDVAQVGVFPINWTRYTQTVRHSKTFLHNIPIETSMDLTHTEQETLSNNWLEALQNAPSEQQQAVLIENLHALIATILGLADNKRIELRQGLRELGLDSILSIEVRSQLETQLACSLPATLLFDYPTIETLSQYLSENILKLTPENTDSDDDDTVDDMIFDDIDSLLSDLDQISDADIQQQFTRAKNN